jgi:TRAP-type C4-dicarboxylate transport system permease small subunit
MMSAAPSSRKGFFALLNRLEETVLASLLAVMVLLGFLQILYRNILSVSLFWVDPLQRHLVLWVALLGASVATREDRHIAIDILSDRLSPRGRSALRLLVHLFSAAVCFILVAPALRFVQEEYPMGKILALGIPIWLSEAIIPLMMAVLGFRFLGKVWSDLAGLKRHPS